MLSSFFAIITVSALTHAAYHRRWVPKSWDVLQYFSRDGVPILHGHEDFGLKKKDLKVEHDSGHVFTQGEVEMQIKERLTNGGPDVASDDIGRCENDHKKIGQSYRRNDEDLNKDSAKDALLSNGDSCPKV